MDLKPSPDSTIDVGSSTFDVPQNRKPMIKNIPFGESVALTELVSYQSGQVVSRTLAQNKHMSMSVFAFAQGEGLSTHSSSGDAMVQVLDGVGQFTVGKNPPVKVIKGQTMVLPANVPHAVDAPEDFKMLLTVVKPPKI